MNDRIDDRRAPGSTAAEWYVALDARGRPAGVDTQHAVDASFAAWLTRAAEHERALERCEAAAALAQNLAEDAELRFAYDEARALACRRPVRRPARGSTALVWTAAAGLAAIAATLVIAVRAPLAQRGPAPLPRAVATAADILAAAPLFNPGVVLPNEFVVDARALAVLPLVVEDGTTPPVRPPPSEFAALLDRELVQALRTVPGLYVVDSSGVPPGAAADLTPSAIGSLVGARGIVTGIVRPTPSGIEVEIVLRDAASDTLLWKDTYQGRGATAPIAAATIEAIAAALAASPHDGDAAENARSDNALASIDGAAERAVE